MSHVLTVNEDLVKGMVDLLVSSGLKKAGYNYFVIDGEASPSWSLTRWQELGSKTVSAILP